MSDSMQEFVARENIARFERNLAIATDADERTLLLEMIGDEKVKLQASQL